MYRILKIIGNNFVSAISEKSETVVLQGLGIGFDKRKGFLVEDSKIERIYHMENDKETNRLTQLVSHIPLEHISFVASLIDEAQDTIENKLRANIYISLTDHVSFSIERFHENKMYANALLNEIKTFYPQEFLIGLTMVKKINKHFDITLPIDEAGFIAMHILDAELSINITETVELTKTITTVMDIIKTYYPNRFKEDSFDTSRLITHVKYLVQGIFLNKLNSNNNNEFKNFLIKQYPNESKCVLKIRDKLEEQFKKKIDDEELLMLAIQINKINK